MSFSVKTPVPSLLGRASRMLEWAGGDLDAVFAQRRNALDPRFLRMVRDILRFNRQATALARDGDARIAGMALGDFLQQEGYSPHFRDWYLLPMAGCIWSCPTEQMLAFPLSSFVHFCHNHGLLQVNDRPQWQTVRGGARQYVRKMLAAIAHRHAGTPVESVTRHRAGGKDSVRIHAAGVTHAFDHVVIASHSDEALGMLSDASPVERRLLSAVQYQPNRAVLHTDASCLPVNRKTWSAWNYQSNGAGAASATGSQVCVHYLINRLQPLPFATPVIVSLNPIDAPAPDSILGSYDYSHPVFDAAAVNAQREFAALQGQRNTWFAGAWLGYGFHEDGLKSGLAVAQALNQAMADGGRVLTDAVAA